jgi:curved DNA-binding protein
MTDFYSTLGVSKSANADEIKRAYRRMANQHHPDKGGDTEKFKEVEEAYRVLSDPQKKAEYDNPQPQFGGPGGFHFHTGNMPNGFEDIFAQFGGSPFGDIFGRQRQPQRNRTLNIQTSITLEEAFFGKDLLATLGLPSGREQTIEVKIPAGIQDGTTLRLTGLGDDSITGIPRGDLHLTVNVQQHRIFQRQGDDLIRSIDISCIDAMLGKKVSVTTLDNKTLEVTVNPGTQPGQTLSAAGYGMPKMADPRFKGRMLITVNITIPQNLTEDQKSLLEQFTK